MRRINNVNNIAIWGCLMNQKKAKLLRLLTKDKGRFHYQVAKTFYKRKPDFKAQLIGKDKTYILEMLAK